MKYGYLFLMCLGLASCTPIAQSSVNSDSNPKVLRMMDFAYEPQIKTIILTPDGAPDQPAATALGQWNLMLQFDDLRAERDTYYARLIHCNHDWTKSDLQDLDFMTQYNEFPLNNSEFSVDTHLPYVHYWLNLPGVKLPGNYVLMVYRGSDKEDIVLTKRFLVYDSQVSFTSNGNLIGAGSIANMNQQLNFTVNYQNINILNPLVDVHVAIRQNQRWDNMATDVKPSFVRDIEKELEYRFFDEAKMFRGGNEFRFFDLRSLNYPGRNVALVDKKQKPFEAYIARDKTRADEAYSQYNDLNGAFAISNQDYKELAFTNYVNVNFTLSSPPVKGDVYVAGGFNYWNLNSENKMQYDSAKSIYTARVLLKQGWYDYQYLVKSATLPPYYFEGTHFETENYYEILVYYKPFQPRADLLIGYLRLDKNAR
ncbi:type IX secretion system plug protein domain-containing protein [Chryseolinea lacunae]|uniref:DUF5103 domain-containing protein n=1 Tax=Chryseolinea lacunae TaxID=2801331 RepID=A0ABS1KX80_9BACT|nr:type IX secretion system plug protein domain-containing protein [Chryseolinea lacunae]MBL0743817.1 DUF5103 domain-containing protein [Chryseolinea lacunae]